MEVTGEELAARLDDEALTVLDVRSSEEFGGQSGYACDPRRGHVPGARNVDVAEIAACSRDELRRLIGLPEGAEIVAYCHSGARSAIATELLRAAGYDARNYRGSWHEWSADPSRPVEGGPRSESGSTDAPS